MQVLCPRSALDEGCGSGALTSISNGDPTGEPSIAEDFWGGEPVGDAELDATS